MIKSIVFELLSFIKIIIIIYQDQIGIITNVIVFLIVNQIKDQVIININYIPKMIIVYINKIYWVVVSYKKVYFTRKITFNDVSSDFVHSYTDIILFLRDFKLHDYEIYIQMIILLKNIFLKIF